MRELVLAVWLFGGLFTAGYISNITPIETVTKAAATILFWPAYIGSLSSAIEIAKEDS